MILATLLVEVDYHIQEVVMILTQHLGHNITIPTSITIRMIRLALPKLDLYQFPDLINYQHTKLRVTQILSKQHLYSLTKGQMVS